MKTTSPQRLRRAPLAARRLVPAPAPWNTELAGMLITGGQLARRADQMAALIQRDYAGREVVAVALLNGSVLFLADLVRRLTLPMRLDFLGVSSYGDGACSGTIHFTKELRLDLRDRDVLVVDDILDTGRTLAAVLKKLRAHQPRSLKLCVLLDKPSRRQTLVRAHYMGFRIPDYFVVGYGLDFAEHYRNLPFIGVLAGPETAA